MARRKPGGPAEPALVIVGEKAVQAFFRDRVTAALSSHGLGLEEATEFYVVNLLSDFARAEQLYEISEDGRRDTVPVAFLLKRAMEQAPEERLRTFKRLGDRSLYVSGFFSDSLASGLVDIDYYIEMGGRAYGSAADLVEPGRGFARGLAKVFGELAAKFRTLVDCLMEVSEEVETTRPGGLVRLYERWLHTRSDRLARRLMEHGLLPAGPGKAGKQRH